MDNVAIVIARTDAAACECLAESMQRGTELTMQDDVRAAARVLRATRTSDNQTGIGI